MSNVGRNADSESNGHVCALIFAFPKDNYLRGMCLRRCEGGVGAFRLIVLFWRTVGTPDSLHVRRLGGSNIDLVASSFAPPGAAIVVAMGG